MVLPSSPTPSIPPPTMVLAPEIWPPDNLESNEPPLESTLHLKQLILLLTCLEWLWRDRTDIFVGGNLTIYYNLEQLTTRDFRGPDLFVVRNTEKRERRSWMVWAEGGKYPDFILELLSDSTAKVDRGLKKELYQDTFRTPEYFWFHPETLEFKGFRLQFQQYQELQPDDRGWLWSEELQLYLGILDGRLRCFTADGALVIQPEEAEQAERQRAEQAEAQLAAERQRAEQAEAQLDAERQRVADLLRQLRQAGLEPNQEG